jgi:hypothetical protein
MRASPLLVACAFALGALPVAAQTMKPGLWEIQNKVNNADMGAAMAEMQKQMAAMPAAERKRMEAMMSQQGVRMAPGAGGGMAMQVCMTREMVERNEVMPMEDGCRITRNQRSGNTTQLAFTCSKPPSSGEGQFTMNGPEAYSSRMVVKTGAGGKTGTTTMESSGKWLKADCGNVKPMVPPKK